MKKLLSTILFFTILLIATTSFHSLQTSAFTIKNKNPIDHIIDITLEYPFENKVQVLQNDGTIWFWKEPDTLNYPLPVIQQGPTLTGAMKITGNRLVLKEDGTVWQWKQNEDEKSYKIVHIKELNNIVDLQSSLNTDIALDKDGVTWIRSNETTIPELFVPSHKNKLFKDKKQTKINFQRAQEGVETFYFYKESIGDNNILLTKKDKTWEYYYVKNYKTGKEIKGVLKGMLPRNIDVLQIIGHEHLNAPKEINQSIILLTKDGDIWRSINKNGWKPLLQNDKQYTNINLIQGHYGDSMLFLSLDHNGDVRQIETSNEDYNSFRIKQLSNIKKMLSRGNGEGIALDQDGYVWKWKADNVVPTLVMLPTRD
jgi:hypothetical protein